MTKFRAGYFYPALKIFRQIIIDDKLSRLQLHFHSDLTKPRSLYRICVADNAAAAAAAAALVVPSAIAWLTGTARAPRPSSSLKPSHVPSFVEGGECCVIYGTTPKTTGR